jgi:hypothetical protein
MFLLTANRKRAILVLVVHRSEDDDHEGVGTPDDVTPRC